MGFLFKYPPPLILVTLTETVPPTVFRWAPNGFLPTVGLIRYNRRDQRMYIHPVGVVFKQPPLNPD